MLAPSVRRPSQGQARTLLMFACGLTLGGAAIALSVWLLSGVVAWVPREVAALGVTACAAFALARDSGVIACSLPQNARQIPRSVFDQRPTRAALRFGLELGVGVRTYLTSTTPYLVAVTLALVAAEPGAAVAMGVGFGVGRFAMPLARSLSPCEQDWDATLAVRLGVLVPTAAAGCAAIAIWLAMSA